METRPRPRMVSLLLGRTRACGLNVAPVQAMGPESPTAEEHTMNHPLARIEPAPPPAPVALVPVDVNVLAEWLDGRNSRTLEAYSRDINDFADFLEQPNGRAAVELLLSLPHGEANRRAHNYRAHLVNRGLRTATIARRLAALRSVVKLARTLGIVVWALDVESPKVEPYRDTAGPGEGGWRSMVSVAKLAAEGRQAKALRDLGANPVAS